MHNYRPFFIFCDTSLGDPPASDTEIDVPTVKMHLEEVRDLSDELGDMLEGLGDLLEELGDLSKEDETCWMA